jgi:hypothetical protein
VEERASWLLRPGARSGRHASASTGCSWRARFRHGAAARAATDLRGTRASRERRAARPPAAGLPDRRRANALRDEGEAHAALLPRGRERGHDRPLRRHHTRLHDAQLAQRPRTRPGPRSPRRSPSCVTRSTAPEAPCPRSSTGGSGSPTSRTSSSRSTRRRARSLRSHRVHRLSQIHRTTWSWLTTETTREDQGTVSIEHSHHLENPNATTPPPKLELISSVRRRRCPTTPRQ